MNKLKQYKYFILVMLIVLGIIFYYYVSEISNMKVVEENKCQDTFNTWSQKNNKEDSDGFDKGIKAHFNDEINTCVVDYLATNKTDGSKIQRMIDIYNNKILLELINVSKSEDEITFKITEVLSENGNETKVPFGDGGNEYNKRKLILLQENN